MRIPKPLTEGRKRKHQSAQQPAAARPRVGRGMQRATSVKLVIISNRLPVTLVQNNESIEITRSGGGLASGLDSLETAAEKHWIGWAGLHVEEKSQRAGLRAELEPMGLHPVFLSPEQIQLYYEGFSNSTLWPLCHYFYSYVQCDAASWRAYKEVNALFCREALKILEPGDRVWVNDFHLMLLPGMLRAHAPELGIGYFHHIPFPSYEMFRCLPERAELLKGLLGADLVGFHTHDYMRHFLSTVYRVLHIRCEMGEAHLKNRIARIDAFPMGINYEQYHNAPETPEARSFTLELRQLAGDCKVVLSIDRLDYSKGILNRLKAFAGFLENCPEYRGRVTLVMVVVPSRDTVPMYADLKTEIDKMIGSINGKYTHVGWVPIHYFYRSFELPELAAMYTMADIALVTPMRDGMNLVAKEFVAAKRDRPGVLILSEMAGAATELSEAIIVNPADTEQIELALRDALAMSEEEQTDALSAMQRKIKKSNVRAWAGRFFRELAAAMEKNRDLREKRLSPDHTSTLRDAFRRAERRLLVLDYDGTLARITQSPSDAFPSQETLELLQTLAADPRNRVVVCSGRDKSTLDRWLGGLPIDLTAEHGVFYREDGIWHQACETVQWDGEICDIMEQLAEKTPRSRVERKQTALVWHYREVDSWLADLRVHQLVESLLQPCTRLGLEIMRGRKIVEVKPAGVNKGMEIRRLLEHDGYGFILAMGDDVTDEDMFRALPEDAFSIKVGSFSETARFYLPDQGQVQPFLWSLAEA